MEFADILFKRIENEDNPKKSINALICFSKRETGKVLGKVIEKMAINRAGKSFITMLNLIDQEQALKIEDEDIYKSNISSEIIEKNETGKFTIRTFVKQYDNYVNEVLKTAEEYNSDFILIGIDNDILNSSLWDKFIKLKSDNIVDEEDFCRELGEGIAKNLRSISTLSNRSDLTIGVLVINRLEKIKNVFIPILKDEDTLTLIYLYRIAKNQDVNVTVWDAIGILDSDQKMQKTFSAISKKVDGRVKIWNNNKKITPEFIKDQNLMIIGKAGWEKLICTPLCWIHDLPSTLIIKDKKT